MLKSGFVRRIGEGMKEIRDEDEWDRGIEGEWLGGMKWDRNEGNEREEERGDG